MAKNNHPKNWLDYDLDACRKQLGKHDDNIKVFEKAIEDELAQKRTLCQIIKVLEDKQSGIQK